jgi:hypothetical protein
MELEAVVSYSPIPPDDDPEKDGERVEPRLTVLPIERKRRMARVAPPSAEESAGRDADIEDAEIIEADFVAPPVRGRRQSSAAALEEDRPRRRISGVVIVGLVALVLGVGVLAYTFTRVMNGNAAVTPATTIPATDVAAPSDDSGSAGPGVLALPPEATAPSAADAAKASAPATATAPASDTAAPVPPPLPRLRPANDTGAPAATDTAVVSAPVAPAAPPAAPVAVTGPPAAVAPAPAAAAPASSDPDVDALMQDVGRFLAAPSPSDATTPADVAAGAAPAAPVPLATAPGVAAASTDDYPPLPAPSQPPQSRWFQDDNGSSIPVPPADIPDPEGAAGQ